MKVTPKEREGLACLEYMEHGHEYRAEMCYYVQYGAEPFDFIYYTREQLEAQFDVVLPEVKPRQSLNPEEIKDDMLQTTDPLDTACQHLAAYAQANHKLISRVHGCEGIVIELERRLEQVTKLTEEMKPLMASVKSK